MTILLILIFNKIMYNNLMAVALDNIHIEPRYIDGYDKAFNFIVCPREPGKTSMFWLKKIYIPWKKNKKPWIYMVRQSVEITQALIDSISDTIINKFTDDNVEFQYVRSTFKDGIVDVKINGELFFRIVSLSIMLRRIKLAVLKNVAGVLFDEYIINPETQERYLADEAFKIKEAYTTWTRESEGKLKVYFLANPYSLYNPMFVYLGVDTSKLKQGAVVVGKEYVIWCYQLTEELKAYILKNNPLYAFDDEYKKYAFDGVAILDEKVKLGKMPKNYYLQFVFRIDKKNIGLFKNSMYNGGDKYFAKIVDDVSIHRTLYCFDFKDLINRCAIISNEERDRLNNFKIAMRKRLISFEDINCYYLVEEIYRNL